MNKIEELGIYEGMPLYLRQFTKNSWVDMVKRPYTVIRIINEHTIEVQSAKLIFPVFHYNSETMSDYYKQFDGKRVCFYDTVAESIEPDENGREEILTWHPKRGMFGTIGRDSDYPQYAVFGKYEHQPYLN